MQSLQIAMTALSVLSTATTAAAAFYWYKAAVAPVPGVKNLVGFADPPGILGRPLGGGKPVLMSAGPINELVDALRVQSQHNQRGAIAASIAAAALALHTGIELFVSG